MSTCHIQAKLKTIIELPRVLNRGDSNPENNLDRISLIKDIEVCYNRGLINWRQVKIIELWLEDGFIHNVYELAATLEALATVSGYTDETYIQHTKDIGGATEQEIKHKLEQLSEKFTEELVPDSVKEYLIKEEELLTSHVTME